MSTDLDSLIQEFNDFFLNLYRSTADGDQAQAFLAFEPIGTPITPAMVTGPDGEFSQTLALEQFSSLANTLPVLDGTNIRAPSLNTVDGLYDLMIATAQPLPTSDRDAFDRFRSDAAQALDVALRSPLLPTGRRYCPAVPTPPDWCDAKSESAWTSKSFVHVETTSKTVAPAARDARSAVARRNWQFRSIASGEARLAEAQNVPADLGLTQLQAAPLVSQVKARPAFQKRMRQQVSRPGLSTSLATVALATPIQAASLNDLLVHQQDTNGFAAKTALRAEVNAVRIQALGAAAVAQEVTSRTLELSFKYCLVRVTRPWVSPEVLGLENWFAPGSRAGDLASGTGSGHGNFEVLPMAALVVKDLRIHAEWSESDQLTVQSSIALGPFSLVGRTLVAGGLSCAGMQIVGWLCNPMPVLPPASDPALEPRVPEPPAIESPAPEAVLQPEGIS